jgi:hypothetical protein
MAVRVRQQFRLPDHKHSNTSADGSPLDNTTMINNTKLVDAILVGVVA